MMPRLILLSFFCSILFNGCSQPREIFKSRYDPQYKVLDRGQLDVIVKSSACALFVQDAVSGAKKSAEFHLRSIVGNQNHRKEFQEVRRFYDDDKICVEISATALPPF